MRLTRYDLAVPTKAQRNVFDCGTASLNEWLARQARQSMASRDAVTYLLLDEAGPVPIVAGYFCLAAGSVDRHAAPEGFGRHAPDPIPAIRMGRFAIDRRYQGLGWGAQLLLEALLSAVSASELLGARLLLVDALNDEASAFYERFGFSPSPIHARQLMFDLRAVAASAGL